jgi:hypothetical protein
MWSDDEDEFSTVVVSSISPILPVDGEGAASTGLLKIRSTSKSIKGKKRDEESAGAVNESASPDNEALRKGSWGFPRIPIPGSPSTRPESYTAVPIRISSPRFRTPESSPRKPSYARSSGNVRMVDTSVLAASPPTLTSPRLDSELFLNAALFDFSGEPTLRRTRSSRAVAKLEKDEDQSNADTKEAASPLLPQSGQLERYRGTKRDPRSIPSRALSAASDSTISEFPGDPPPKRTPAERFHARHSALGKVEDIIQRSRSQTSVASPVMSPERLTLGTVEEDKQLARFGRVGREFESGGIEQRLFES